MVCGDGQASQWAGPGYKFLCLPKTWVKLWRAQPKPHPNQKSPTIHEQGFIQFYFKMLTILTLVCERLARKVPNSLRTSSKSHPASDTVVLLPDSRGVDSASCGSCACCTQAQHLVPSGASGHPSQYRVLSGLRQLSNPASHASRLQPQQHRTSVFTTTPKYPPSLGLLGV